MRVALDWNGQSTQELNTTVTLVQMCLKSGFLKKQNGPEIYLDN
jgi:hypothetical protein